SWAGNRGIAVAGRPGEYSDQARGRHGAGHANSGSPVFAPPPTRFAERALVALRLHEERAVELGQHQLEFRVAACSFPDVGHGFQITRVEGVQVAQRPEVAFQMVWCVAHGTTSSAPRGKCARSACSARHTRTRAAPAVATPRAIAKL